MGGFALLLPLVTGGTPTARGAPPPAGIPPGLLRTLLLGVEFGRPPTRLVAVGGVECIVPEFTIPARWAEFLCIFPDFTIPAILFRRDGDPDFWLELLQVLVVSDPRWDKLCIIPEFWPLVSRKIPVVLLFRCDGDPDIWLELLDVDESDPRSGYCLARNLPNDKNTEFFRSEYEFNFWLFEKKVSGKNIWQSEYLNSFMCNWKYLGYLMEVKPTNRIIEKFNLRRCLQH